MKAVPIGLHHATVIGGNFLTLLMTSFTLRDDVIFVTQVVMTLYLSRRL